MTIQTSDSIEKMQKDMDKKRVQDKAALSAEIKDLIKQETLALHSQLADILQLLRSKH